MRKRKPSVTTLAIEFAFKPIELSGEGVVATIAVVPGLNGDGLVWIVGAESSLGDGVAMETGDPVGLVAEVQPATKVENRDGASRRLERASRLARSDGQIAWACVLATFTRPGRYQRGRRFEVVVEDRHVGGLGRGGLGVNRGAGGGWLRR